MAATFRVSRPVARHLAALYDQAFSRAPGNQPQRLKDLLYDLGHNEWFMKSMYMGCLRHELPAFIRGIHTGESLAGAQWTAEQIEEYGQTYLRGLLDMILSDEVAKTRTKPYETLLRALDVDGYAVVDGRVVAKDAAAPLVAEQRAYLEGLYERLGLIEQALAKKHYQQSEADYVNGVPGNAISNARHFVEVVLRNTARRVSQLAPPVLSDRDIRSQKAVHSYLLSTGFLSEAEYELVRKLYGILSGKGGHPNMAKQDEARLTRHYALITCEFVLLRLDNLTAPKVLDPVRERFVCLLDQRRGSLAHPPSLPTPSA
jgi:hypothetical protein